MLKNDKEKNIFKNIRKIKMKKIAKAKKINEKKAGTVKGIYMRLHCLQIFLFMHDFIVNKHNA